MKERKKLQENGLNNIVNGLKWIPIREKAMEVHEDFEKKNEHDLCYQMGISDVLYYALCIFQKAIEEHDGDVHDLIKDYRDDFLLIHDRNRKFMGEFGELEHRFKNNVDEIRNKKWGKNNGF